MKDHWFLLWCLWGLVSLVKPTTVLATKFTRFCSVSIWLLFNSNDMQVYPPFQVIICFSLFASFVTSPHPPLVLQSLSESFFEKRAIPANHVTYVESQLPISMSENWRRPSWSPNPLHNPDTTVVLLNWARLPNVVLQASVYCGPLLRDVVERVFIWNNQPKVELSYETVSKIR